MAPIMIKKLLAKYSITITGTMLAYFAIKLCMTTGIYLLYKNNKKSNLKIEKKPSMLQYMLKGAKNVAEFSLIFGIIQPTQLASPYWIPPFGGALSYLGFAKEMSILKNVTLALVYGLLFGGGSFFWVMRNQRPRPPAQKP